MLKTFREGGDIHTENAKIIFGKKEVTHFERRFAKTGTFSLVYGADEKSIAQNYFDGNQKAARDFLDKFDAAFPAIKKWQTDLKEKVQVTGKVPLMTNRFIKIDVPSKNDISGFNKALREAGNYPIQGASSDVAGCTAYEIDRYSQTHGLLLNLFLFIHDSIESDCPPFEMIEQFVSQTDVLANYPTEVFHMLCKADLSCGASLGHECEITDLMTNDKYTEAVFTIEGYKDEIEETMEPWYKNYAKVETYNEKWNDQFVDMSDFFIPRKAISPYFLKTRQNGSLTVHIKYYNDDPDELKVVENDEGVEVSKV